MPAPTQTVDVTKRTERIRESIITKICAVPGLPTSSVKIIGMLQDPEVEMPELVEALEYDPGLTANILRWANSAYFGGRHEILSVRDAVVRLGMKRMNQLVMTSIAAPIVNQPVRGYDLPPGSLLEHSIAVAIGAVELCKAKGITPPESVFTAGLLHDIGKIVLGMFVEVASQPILEAASAEHTSFDEAERRILGIDHAEVGAILLDRWNLPRSIVDVVRWHHQPQEYEGESTSLDMVHVAEVLCLECGIGTGIDGLNYRPSTAVMERVNLKPAAAEQVVSRMLSSLDEIRDVVLTPAARAGAR